MAQPRSIGKYQITGLLGTGGQGQVHAAVDPELGRDVAIKSLHQGQGTDAATVSRFRAEAKSLARIVHSNITTLIDFLAINDHLYMIMELVRGRTLDAVLQERGKGLGTRESLAIIAQAADGLAYAHEMGVIHRDIKPSNLMITDNGRVKIMDFGIARVRGSDRLTRVGSAVGTPLYMSPEQCKGSDGDERSDIYSLAIVLYELLLGEPPFRGDTDHQLTEAHIRTPPSPLVPRVPGVDARIESAIMKALSKRPEQRFASMQEFSEALGANALLAQATSVVRSHANLISETTSSHDLAHKRTGVTIALATLRSRTQGALRRFQTLHPAVKGLCLGIVGFALLAVVLLQTNALTLSQRDSDNRLQRPVPDNAARTNASGQSVGQGQAGNTPVDTSIAKDGAAKKVQCSGAFAPRADGSCVPSVQPPNRVIKQSYDEPIPLQDSSPARQSGSAPPTSQPSSFALDNNAPSQSTGQLPQQPVLVPDPPPPQAGSVPSSPSLPRPEREEVAKVIAPPPINRPAPEPTVADLLKEYEQQNYGKAFEIAKKLAKFDSRGDGGDIEAQFTLGRLFAFGRGGAPKDPIVAISWFERAAVRGHAAAQYWIGYLYWNGEAGAKQDCRALPWFQRAADQNWPAALNSMGAFYERGDCRIGKSRNEAIRHYRLAAEKGNAQAITELKRLGEL